MRFTANYRFSTVLQVDGTNLLVSAEKGDRIELSDAEAALLEADLPGAVSPVKPPKSATTKKGRSSSSRTRQVAGKED